MAAYIVGKDGADPYLDTLDEFIAYHGSWEQVERLIGGENPVRTEADIITVTDLPELQKQILQKVDNTEWDMKLKNVIRAHKETA